MSQLEPTEGSALVDVPVEQTDASEQPSVEETPDEQQGEQEPNLAEEMYPDEVKAPDNADSDPDDQDSDPDAEPDGDADGDDEPADEADEPDEPAIDLPKSWKADAKEDWDALPRSIQATITERETERERFVNSKAQEAAQVRDQTVQQAASEIAQFREQQAAAFNQLARQFFPQAPDEQLLYTGNPQDQLTYQQQEAAFKRGQAQQQQLQQMAAQETQEAQRINGELEQQQAAQMEQADVALLQEKLPEWLDETTQAKLQDELTPIAMELGYPEERLPNADAADLVALKTAHGWKVDAEKWRELQKAKMKPVRAAKTVKRQPPTPNKPGSPAGNQQPKSVAEALYPDDVRN